MLPPLELLFLPFTPEFEDLTWEGTVSSTVGNTREWKITMSAPHTPTSQLGRLDVDSTPKKRKRTKEERDQLISAWLKKHPTSDAAAVSLKAILDAEEVFGIAATNLLKDRSFEAALQMLGCDFDENSDQYVWDTTTIPGSSVLPDTETVVRRIRSASFWARSSCESFIRSVTGLILVDRLYAHKDQFGEVDISAQGEVKISTHASTQENTFINGVADYAIGYTNKKTMMFESISVVAEAKRVGQILSYEALAQTIAYMFGCQQRRMRSQYSVNIVDTTYGIMTDSEIWQFLRLSGNKLWRSRVYFYRTDDRLIHGMIDHIIKATISLSPHSTPAKAFPPTQIEWEAQVESPLLSRSQIADDRIPDGWHTILTVAPGQVELAPLPQDDASTHAHPMPESE